MELKKDKWLSTLLGKPSYGMQFSSPFEAEFPKVLPEGFQYAKLPYSSKDSLSEFFSNSFNLVSVDVGLVMEPVSFLQEYKGRYVLRAARLADKTEVGEIAASVFSFDRFHMDPFIDNNIAHEVKRKWACNFFEGKRGTHMYVAEVKGKIVAFLLVLIEKRTFVIDLIGVANCARGKGIGSELIKYALSQAQPKTVKVGTQLSNIASLKTYNRLGFNVDTSFFVLHRHSNRGEA